MIIKANYERDGRVHALSIQTKADLSERLVKLIALGLLADEFDTIQYRWWSSTEPDPEDGDAPAEAEDVARLNMAIDAATPGPIADTPVRDAVAGTHITTSMDIPEVLGLWTTSDAAFIHVRTIPRRPRLDTPDTMATDHRAKGGNS